ENIMLMPSLLNGHKNRIELLLKGLFNTSPIWDYLKELFTGRVYSSIKRIWIWSTFFLLTRAELAYFRTNNLHVNIRPGDICYFYWGLRWSQVLPFLNMVNTKIIVRFHGSDIYENVNHNYIPMRTRQLECAEKAIFISKCGYNYLTMKFPFIKDKSDISRLGSIDYGLNPYQLEEPVRIVSCSNLVPVKRVAIIAESLKFIDFKLSWIHIGDGPQRENIQNIIRNLPENIMTELKGSLNHDEVMDFYHRVSLNIFLNVSSSEGIPVSIMEALSFGIPVIATDVGGVSEITDNETGALVPADISPESLSSEIAKLVNRKDYADMRIKARKRWEERCNADEIYPEFVKMLSEA
ncbi:MAG TPA: glycosyltransferase, partial [Bacteroidales bacterium]|nr:glycosyltransferase [Bacteroidales bacterium]